MLVPFPISAPVLHVSRPGNARYESLKEYGRDQWNMNESLHALLQQYGYHVGRGGDRNCMGTLSLVAKASGHHVAFLNIGEGIIQIVVLKSAQAAYDPQDPYCHTMPEKAPTEEEARLAREIFYQLRFHLGALCGVPVYIKGMP